MVLEAHDIVGTRFPPAAGRTLADAVLLQDDWSTLEIDLRQCPAALLISGFFSGFLQQIADEQPERLRAARKITWLTDFEFQSANILYWIDTFVPRPPCTP